MLDEYFEEQMKEVIRMCSHHRQTMLFSATMTDEVGVPCRVQRIPAGQVLLFSTSQLRSYDLVLGR